MTVTTKPPATIAQVSAWVAAHRKLLVALFGMVVVMLAEAFGTEQWWVAGLVAAATALGVYAAPNTPAAP